MTSGSCGDVRREGFTPLARDSTVPALQLIHGGLVGREWLIGAERRETFAPGEWVKI
jgi:hypothetical protein